MYHREKIRSQENGRNKINVYKQISGTAVNGLPVEGSRVTYDEIEKGAGRCCHATRLQVAHRSRTDVRRANSAGACCRRHLSWKERTCLEVATSWWRRSRSELQTRGQRSSLRSVDAAGRLLREKIDTTYATLQIIYECDRYSRCGR